MKTDSYEQHIIVSSTANAAYQALTSGYGNWWTAGSNSLISVGDRITFRFGSTYWVMCANVLSLYYIELECIEAHHVHDGLPPSILNEWKATKLKWTIKEQDKKTKITLTHEGLIPSLDCFDVCKDGWDFFFVTSLKQYLNEGKGSPFKA